jgi:hypothetical protein
MFVYVCDREVKAVDRHRGRLLFPGAAVRFGQLAAEI